MIKIILVDTGKVIEVTRNEAHGLIETGIARLYKSGYETKPYMPSEKRYRKKRKF